MDQGNGIAATSTKWIHEVNVVIGGMDGIGFQTSTQTSTQTNTQTETSTQKSTQTETSM